MNSYKKFSKSDYDKYDNKGKQVAIKLITHFGWTLKDDSEAFSDRDLIFTKDGKDVWVEAEYSPSWKLSYWPRRWGMTCPTRKKKSLAHLYIRTNESQTVAIVVPMAKVHDAPIIIKDTSYTKDETFYSVHIDECDVFDLSEPDKTNNRYILS